jgi:hypothetical protein
MVEKETQKTMLTGGFDGGRSYFWPTSGSAALGKAISLRQR